MRRRARKLAPLVVALLLIAPACTAGPPAETSQSPADSPAASPADSPAESPEESPEESPAEAATSDLQPLTQPLVIVTHTTRPPLDLSMAAARRLIAGDGVGVGGVRVVAAPGTEAPDPLELATARAAVRAVIADRDTVAVLPARAVGPGVQSVQVEGIDPLLHPARYPIRTGAESAPKPVVRVSVVGDIMLGRGVADAARAEGDPSLALRPMQRRLAGADITVGNLESTLSTAGAPTQGGDSFAAPPAVVRGLRDAGFDVLGLANNHLGDFGDRALVETVRRLHSGGLDTFGAGADPPRAWQPAVVERAGVRFGFLGFNAIGETPAVRPGQPGAVSVSMPPRTGPLNRDELGRFLRAVRRLDGAVDVVVAMPHWGTQYTNVPDPIQHRVAARLVAAGADVVAAGHPHWVQGAHLLDGSLVVHSLGNFVFDMDFMEETQKGLLLELTFWGGDLKAAHFVPYAMDENFAPRAQSFREGISTMRLMWATSGAAFRR